MKRFNERTEHMTDNELLRLLKTDPQNGLEAVVRQYNAYVMKIAYLRLNDVCTNEDIEETVSDIFLKFFQFGCKNNFDISSVKAVLSVISARHCIDVFRKKMQEIKSVSIDELPNEIGVFETYPSDSIVADILKELNDIDRKIIIRRYFFGQKSREIAKDLNMRPSAVDTRISRALVRLRKIIKEDDR